MFELARDFLYALRQLRRNPATTFIAITVLMLGIGANSALFSILDPLLLRKLPVDNPDELIHIGSVGSLGDTEISEFSTFIEYRDKGRNVADIFAVTPMVDCAAEHGDMKRASQCAAVSGNYFTGLGVRPFLGRMLELSDENTPVVVLNFSYWKRELNSDPAVVGRGITLDNVPYTIVGVAPDGFFGIEVGKSSDIYLPVNNSSANDSWVTIVGRMKPGVTRARAYAELNPLFQQLVKNSLLPEITKQQFVARLTIASASRGLSEVRDQFSMPSRILAGAVGLILLVACANIAGLRLLQGIARRKEIAVRMAMGAGRWKIVRQLLIEGILLAVLAATAGLLLAKWMSTLLISAVTTENFSIVLNSGMTPRVLLFTTAAVVFSAISSSMLPGLLAMRSSNLVRDLKLSATDMGGRNFGRWGDVMVVVQIALSGVILVCSCLLLRSLVGLERFDAVYDRDHVLIASIDTSASGKSPEQITAFLNEVRRQAEGLPGITDTSYSSFTPISGAQMAVNVVVEDRPLQVGERANTSFVGISANYFRTLGITLLQGRDFADRDVQFPPKTVIINRTMARRYFGDENPLGKRLRFVEGNRLPMEIIGIVADSKQGSLRELPRDFFYTPSSSGKTIEFRTAASPHMLMQPVRKLIASIDPMVEIISVKSLRDQIEESYRMDKVVTALCGFFGVLALFLSGLGLYGSLSFAVGRRAKEIAIRMALGATSGDVIRSVIMKGMGLTLAGLVVGLPAGLASVNIVKGFLFGVGLFDALTFIAVAILLFGTALLACYFPVRRIVALDPCKVLRME